MLAPDAAQASVARPSVACAGGLHRDCNHPACTCDCHHVTTQGRRGPAPLGVPPRWLVEERRAQELAKAVERYARVDGSRPWWREQPEYVVAWLEELLELVGRQRQNLNREKRPHG